MIYLTGVFELERNLTGVFELERNLTGIVQLFVQVETGTQLNFVIAENSAHVGSI